ncbi:molecular chaperone DnaK [Bacillus sp. V3-13]|uniref:TraR/DksA C4-type zinc finger protein n=1 Tax=Bacillus sp. V3-13 TaxID=2053728 RepID=UPI000C781C83|nr:TraR/DksA C4-type zinc finger protein [Bacillus sp. V3-13]PLR79415.1 molecular chaperone DnaK [Bacillus sp. V3-13]
MLSTEQQNQLKSMLEENKHQLEHRLSQNKEEAGAREAAGELSMYDNHPADMGTELFEREKDFALEGHADFELDKINAALKAIEAGTYGKCAECGKDIPFERLEAIPAALFCKEHSPDQLVSNDRPVEEEVLEPAQGNTFQHHQFREVIDNEDSFREAARYGTSETPADLKGDYQNYNDLYNDDDDEGFTEDYETFAATGINGKNRQFYRSKKQEKYEEMLDDKNIESPLGNIPYHRSDGYVEGNHKDKK